MTDCCAKTGKWKYAVNTNSLPKDMTPGQMAALAAQAKADGMEWGLPGLAQAPAAARDMAKAARDQGLEVCGFINAGNLTKTDDMRRWSEAVAAAGGKSLRVSPFWVAWDFNESLHQRESFADMFRKNREGLERLIPMGKEFGIRYVIELHMGYLAPGADLARRLLEGLDPAVVGAIYDPANGLGEGHLRPRNAVEILGPYLAYVHAKNLMWVQDGHVEDGRPRRAKWQLKTCRLDEGILDWVEVFFALNIGRVSGWIALEEFFRPAPAEEVVRGIEFLKQCAAIAPENVQEPFTTFND